VVAGKSLSAAFRVVVLVQVAPPKLQPERAVHAWLDVLNQANDPERSAQRLAGNHERRMASLRRSDSGVEQSQLLAGNTSFSGDRRSG